MQFPAEALGRETQLCCLSLNADFRLMSKRFCDKRPFHYIYERFFKAHSDLIYS